MPDKILTRTVLLLFLEVGVILLVFAGLNFFVLPRTQDLTAFDWFLFEGILFIIISVLFALGRGGIDAYTLRSAATAAVADAVYGKDYQVSEVFRKDKWKPEGFPKAALVLLVTGIVMLIIYFLTL
jgi:hypothetical protein